MPSNKKKRDTIWKSRGVVSPNVGNHGNDPAVIRKKNEAIEFLKRVGLPEGWEKGERMFPVAKSDPSAKTTKKSIPKKQRK